MSDLQDESEGPRGPAEDAILGPIILRRLWTEHVVAELQRRGITQSPEQYVQKVQILHQIGVPRLVVRLNEEVKIRFLFRYEGPTIPAGTTDIPPEHIGDIYTVELEEDLAGHEVIIRNRAGWWVSFDFRYYRNKIMTCVEIAGEFLYAARAAIEADGMHAFAENLYVAAEQLAWAQLLFIPHPEIVHSRKHENILRRFNQWVKMGNASPRFAKALNRLAQLRNPARYRPEQFHLNETEARGILALMEIALREMSTWRPSRAMGPFPLPSE